MALKTLLKSELVAKYVHDDMTPIGDVKRRLRDQTGAMTNGGMQVSADQGALLAMFARMLGARRALEVGTFTGYSALCVAEALPADGKLVACDVSDEWTSVGRKYWAEAGVAGKIDLRLGPAAETLEKLLGEFGPGSFDFAFIDADKTAYDTYYEGTLKLIRPGGAIVLDNVLMGGRVPDESVNDASIVALRELNRKIRDDGRVWATMVAVGDGFMVALKK